MTTRTFINRNKLRTTQGPVSLFYQTDLKYLNMVQEICHLRTHTRMAMIYYEYIFTLLRT